MEGRDHTGVVWILSSCGDAPADEWDRWYTSERMPALATSGAIDRAERLRLAAGFELAGGASHVVICETNWPDVGDAARAVAALTAASPFASSGAGEAVSHYIRTTTIGGSGGAATGGVVAVLTDCSAPEAEDAFDVWYDEHARFVVEHMDHHTCTRYRSGGGPESLAGHLAIYETESADPGRVQRDGWDWYFQSPQAKEHETPDSLVLRGEVALERLG